MHHSKLFSGNDPMSKINKNTQIHQLKVVFYKHFRIVSEICAQYMYIFVYICLCAFLNMAHIPALRNAARHGKDTGGDAVGQ